MVLSIKYSYIDIYIYTVYTGVWRKKGKEIDSKDKINKT